MSNYTKPSISGYNTNPPPDDATTGADNQLQWSKHKTKLADPIKTLVDDINDQCDAAFGKLFLHAVTTVTATGSIDATYRDKLVKTSNAITLTLLAAATAGDGFAITFYNSDSSSSLTLDGNSTETINGSETYVIAPGGSVVLVCNGTNWDLLEISSGNNSITQNVIADHKNLVCKYVTASTVDIDADAVLLESGELVYKASSVNLTVDITASGANGLDTGSEASSTWYYLWVIYNGSTVASLLSTSSTAPTMPSGYTNGYKGLVGSVYNDSGSDFDNFYQSGTRVAAPFVTMLTNGSATTATAIDLSAVVPPIARIATGSLRVGEAGGTTNANASIYADSGGLLEQAIFHKVAGTSTSAKSGGYFSSLMADSQTIYYAVAASADDVDIYSHGWEY
jgi:hypothetical protein